MQASTKLSGRIFIVFTFLTVFGSSALAAASGVSAASGLASVPIPEASTVAVFALAAVELLRRRPRK